jgi:SlyX protein
MTPDTDNDTQALLVDLQTRLAFQDHTISELNDVITDQQKQLDRLHEQVRMLKDKLDVLEESVPQPGNLNAADEKPPHY